MLRDRKLRFTVLSGVLCLALACDGSSPLAPDGSDDGSPFHQSNATVESALVSGSDPSDMTIVLGGDVRVRVTDATTIDADGDLTTLDEFLDAIDAGVPVRIEIDGRIEDGIVTATRIRFETDSDDDGIADDEVHGTVAAVDLAARTVTLADGRMIRVATDAAIEPDGDFRTLAEVAAALSGGLTVRVEADLSPLTGGVREATSAKFESDQADGPGDDDADDDGGIADDEVHGTVAAVDLAARTVTLADGRVIRVATDAAIETDGDFRTLAEVAAALAGGLTVRVEADLGPLTGGVREATNAKFESDQADGPGDDDDDDGDDDNSGPGNGDDDGDDDNSGPGNGDDDGDDDNSGPGGGN